MDNKVRNIAESISDELSNEKAYEIANVCNRYNLGDGTSYSSPASKQKFLLNLLLEKSETFLLELANKIVEDYKSDKVAYCLNEYYDGRYFKISIITRKELLDELLAISGLNGKMSISDFLSSCSLFYRQSFSVESIFGNVFSSGIGFSNVTEPNLNDIILENKLHEVLDSRFFNFLEQIVHPYVRSNAKAEPFISLINKHIGKDNHVLQVVNSISGEAVYKVIPKVGISNIVKNLIFASNSFKPEIVLTDALSNTIKIVKNEEFCLVYDRPIKLSGLLWIDLVDWWANNQGEKPSKEQAITLKNRLSSSLASPPEIVLFNTYFKEMSVVLKRNLPALIPQVYLHYDPYSLKKFGFQYLLRQRMDFLLLLKNNVRVVIEVDGVQHYSEGSIPSPKLYGQMVAQDRELKIAGYELYRFGGYELVEQNIAMIRDFFIKLFEKHGVM